jgi:hypothetical protein
MYGWGG